MADLLDYVDWRGDLTFKVSPFNDVDALILVQLSYLNFDGLISSSFKEKITLKDLWYRFSSAPDFKKRCDTGMLINRATVQLLEKVAGSKRYSNLYAAAYISKYDAAIEEQFSAMTFFESRQSRLPFVAFRGTDDTIVGWKEDFNLVTETAVPAQLDAVKYVEYTAENTRGKIIVGGHSKGGNLAIYSAAFSKSVARKRIQKVYNFDGPGFRKELMKSEGMQLVTPLVQSYYPYFSIVGMLFEHAGDYTVVESEASGVMQHDPFSWHMKAQGFVTKDGFDTGSIYFHTTFNTWLEGISKEQRELFVETLFQIIQATEARTNSELSENFFHNAHVIISAIKKLDKETAEEVVRIAGLLFECAQKNFPDSIGNDFMSKFRAKFKSTLKNLPGISHQEE